MINYIENCAFVRYMKWDYFKAPKWLRLFYDFVAKRINLFLNWRMNRLLPPITNIQIKEIIYDGDTDYYIDYLWMPKTPEEEEREKVYYCKSIYVETGIWNRGK